MAKRKGESYNGGSTLVQFPNDFSDIAEQRDYLRRVAAREQSYMDAYYERQNKTDGIDRTRRCQSCRKMKDGIPRGEKYCRDCKDAYLLRKMERPR